MIVPKLLSVAPAVPIAACAGKAVVAPWSLPSQRFTWKLTGTLCADDEGCTIVVIGAQGSQVEGVFHSQKVVGLERREYSLFILYGDQLSKRSHQEKISTYYFYFVRISSIYICLFFFFLVLDKQISLFGVCQSFPTPLFFL